MTKDAGPEIIVREYVLHPLGHSDRASVQLRHYPEECPTYAVVCAMPPRWGAPSFRSTSHENEPEATTAFNEAMHFVNKSYAAHRRADAV